MPINPEQFIVFTDLDGTLLDEEDYSFSAADRALCCLQKKQVPVIPTTSKTLPEVAALCKDIGLNHPLIVENGSAVCIPDGYFTTMPETTQQALGYRILVLGKTYVQVRRFFARLCQEFDLEARGFNDFSADDVVRLTGLPPEAVRGARQRGFSEPFIVNDEQQIDARVEAYAKQNGYRILRGNRFFHLLGDTDKGRAVQQVKALYEAQKGVVVLTAGLGDSPNDLAMLKAVDYPFQVRKKDGTYRSGLESAQPVITNGSGPAGWQEAVFSLPGLKCS